MMLRFCALALMTLACSTSTSAETAAEDRPNVLWITAEDMSPTLGCYGDTYAITPNIDRLAEESVRYTHAFATAPVCSPSRSCLITGCYAPSLGTHNMRSSFPLPASMNGFPSLLRDAGWFTSNNVKTDYNTSSSHRVIQKSWNENSPKAHWRNRTESKKALPFFSVFNIMTSHQSRSMVWPYEQFQSEVQSKLPKAYIHDPANAPVPPYYPDTPTIRREIARYYDCVSVMDRQVGEILHQLAEDGHADETIVFFYSDHGSGMPRHKRALLDSGMKVPLLVRFPEKYRHLAPSKPGTSTDQLVSFVDFGPTVLSLAGLEIPNDMHGKPFLGRRKTEPRDYVFGHRDRIDEVMDTARSVRNHKYLYIRNYQPHLGYNQPSAWPEQGEIRGEFTRLAKSEKWTPAQKHFAGPNRPVEELYDCELDPSNLNNLANSQEHRTVRDRLRNVLSDHLTKTIDTGFVPETTAWKLLKGRSAWEARTADLKSTYLEAISAADTVGTKSEELCVRQLSSPNEVQRYWAAMALVSVDTLSKPTIDSLKKTLHDDALAVRLAAANALATHGETDAALPVARSALKSQDVTDVLYAIRTIEQMGEKASVAVPDVKDVIQRMAKLRGDNTDATVVLSKDADMAMFVEFSAHAFLKQVEKKDRHNAATDKWTPLFNSKSLDGWRARAEGDVKVVNGEIHILSKGKNLWLMHDKSFDDFELKIEAHMPTAGYNSGIGFRCTGAKGRPKGYQCEIENEKSGMIYAIGSGWVWPRGKEESAKFREMSREAFRVDKWNTFRIRCVGNHIQIWVNDVKTADVMDDRFAAGSIALQHHGKGDVHRFRNIQIRKINGNQ